MPIAQSRPSFAVLAPEFRSSRLPDGLARALRAWCVVGVTVGLWVAIVEGLARLGG
jgi:hypothetical protein